LLYLGLIWDKIFKQFFTVLKKDNKVLDELRPQLTQLGCDLLTWSDYPENLVNSCTASWLASWRDQVLQSEVIGWVQTGCTKAAKFFQTELRDLLNPGPLPNGVGSSLPSNDRVESIFGRLTTVLQKATSNMHPQVAGNVTSFQMNKPSPVELVSVLRDCVPNGKLHRQNTPTTLELKRKRCEADSLKLEQLRQKKLKKEKKL